MKSNTPDIPNPKELKSTMMCSGQPKFTIEQIKDHFPSLLQNIMKINIQMKPADGTNFEVSNFVWSIQQFFRICKAHDKEFRILPWNIENQDDSTIKGSSLTDYKQIPVLKEAFEEYGYNIHISMNRMSLAMIISTSYATFEKMFKDSSKKNGERQSILRQFRERSIWVTKNDLSTMGTTKFVGFLSYAHPTLTNQYKLLSDLRKITKIPDLTVENYNPKIFKQANRNEKATLICSTVAYCIGAPADISVDVMQTIMEKWKAVRKGEYTELLGPTSNIHKFLFIPMSKVLMSDETRAEHMRKNNAFRFSYNGISLNKTRNIDVPFKLTEEESREIGFSGQNLDKEVTIRTIINSWVSSDDGNPMVWMIEPMNEQRQVMIIKEQATEAVRREASALFTLLKKRSDFRDIVGGSEGAHVDGYQAHSPEAREYMEELQETLVCIDNKRKEEYPALPPANGKTTQQRQRKKKVFNPYSTSKFVQSAHYADVVQVIGKKATEKAKKHKENDSESEKTQVLSTVSSLTNSTEKSNKDQSQEIRHPKQLQKGQATMIKSTDIVKAPTKQLHGSEATTTSTVYTSNSSEIENYTDREQYFLNYIKKQDRRLQALEDKQQETIETLQATQKQHNEKINKTITAKLQPHNERLESISDSINNMKAKTEANQTTMSKMDERFDKLDDRLDRMLNIYERMVQMPYTQQKIETTKGTSDPYVTKVTQSQEQEPMERSNNDEKQHLQQKKEYDSTTNKPIERDNNQTTLWSSTASPQPKRTPNKKMENIKETKIGQLAISPTTEEKGQKRGEKRQKTPQKYKQSEIPTTAKIKQEMIDDAIMTSQNTQMLQRGYTQETSINIEQDGDDNDGWITMGKNNTPKKKEEMKSTKKGTFTSPATTRSSKRTTIANNIYPNGMTVMKTRKASSRTKSPQTRKTAATQPKRNPETKEAQRGEMRRGEVGLRGSK